mgnify:CR=1 FL=1
MLQPVYLSRTITGLPGLFTNGMLAWPLLTHSGCADEACAYDGERFADFLDNPDSYCARLGFRLVESREREAYENTAK